MYAITDDIKALSDLMNNLVDEDGEPREPTPEEFEDLKEMFSETESNFKSKFDSYCKFIKNLKLQAEEVTDEKNRINKEAKRLVKREKAFINRAKSVQDLLRYNMQCLKMENFKTSLFSATEQKQKYIVSIQSTFDASKMPEEYLKPREVSKEAITKAVESGELVQKEGVENYGKLFYSEKQLYKTGEQLEGVVYLQGSALVLR